MSDKTLVINLTHTAIFVDVRRANGAEDAVQIQPRGRVHLGVGQRVDKRWMERHSAEVKVHDPVVAVQVVEAPAAPTPVFVEPDVVADDGDETQVEPDVVADDGDETQVEA